MTQHLRTSADGFLFQGRLLSFLNRLCKLVRYLKSLKLDFEVDSKFDNFEVVVNFWFNFEIILLKKLALKLYVVFKLGLENKCTVEISSKVKLTADYW